MVPAKDSSSKQIEVTSDQETFDDKDEDEVDNGGSNDIVKLVEDNKRFAYFCEKLKDNLKTSETQVRELFEENENLKKIVDSNKTE